MADYNRDRSGGGRDRGGRSFGGGRDSGRGGFGGRGGHGGGRGEERQMFKAICGECGDQCQVPFRPSGDRPVLCRDCFGGNDRKPQSRNNEFRERDNRGGRDSYEEKSYRKDSFRDAPKDNYQEQLDSLHVKLDKILKLITPVFSVSKEKHEAVAAKLEANKAGAGEEKLADTSDSKAKKAKKAVKKTKSK